MHRRHEGVLAGACGDLPTHGAVVRQDEAVAANTDGEEVNIAEADRLAG